MGPGIRLRTGRERPRPGLVGTDREAGAPAPRGAPPRPRPQKGDPARYGGGAGPASPRGPPPVAVTYWFQRNLSGLISPVEPVIHPPRASAKDWPLFVFQQLIPSWVEWQA